MSGSVAFRFGWTPKRSLDARASDEPVGAEERKSIVGVTLEDSWIQQQAATDRSSPLSLIPGNTEFTPQSEVDGREGLSKRLMHIVVLKHLFHAFNNRAWLLPDLDLMAPV